LKVPEDLDEEEAETYMVLRSNAYALYIDGAHEILAWTRGIVSIYIR